MKATRLVRRAWWVALLAIPWLLPSQPAQGYVEIAYSLGRLLNESTHVVLIRVEQVDKTKNTIIYRKVRDVKGTHPGETIKHDIGKRGFHPREWQNVMDWAAPGKSALMFHNGGASETCIDGYWYQAYAGDWWAMSHAEPFFNRSYCGSPEKLAGLVASMLAGQEVVVPCMVDGDKNALQLRTARLQRMKASTKLADYNAQRDFMGWGVEEFRAITNMPGFTHYAPIAKVYPDAMGVAAADFNGDGKCDLCLYGANKVVVLKNGGDSFDEVSLALEGGARAAAWGDYDADGKPDLLLATPTGPRLFRNEGAGFRDITSMLPRQPYENLTAAAWIDHDGDKRPDILLADGFLGLRLLHNNSATVPTPPAPAAPAAPGAAPAAPPASPKPGVWYHAGPFDNAGNKGFATAYPPEQKFDFAARWDGKGGARARWREATFEDGKVNTLALYKEGFNENATVYLYREMEFAQAMELPVSFGSHDTLTVWLNGTKVLEQNVTRPCAADQAQVTLKLKAGTNALLVKVCSQKGPAAFYFAAKKAIPTTAAPKDPLFADVSDSVGLGVGGVGGKLKGDNLAVADVNADGRADVLYSAGAGLLILNTPKGFVAAEAGGIAMQPGRVAPAFGDFDGDGLVDLFVPQDGACKLFKGDGKGHFTDVTAASGALAGPIPMANCAAWSDFSNRGKLDLFVGCLKGPNRYFRNLGGGKFADAGNELGFYRRIFNTRGLAVVDMNKDGVLDLVFTNEGQESSVLLGDRARLPVAPPAPAAPAAPAAKAVAAK